MVLQHGSRLSAVATECGSSGPLGAGYLGMCCMKSLMGYGAMLPQFMYGTGYEQLMTARMLKYLKHCIPLQRYREGLLYHPKVTSAPMLNFASPMS